MRCATCRTEKARSRLRIRSRTVRTYFPNVTCNTYYTFCASVKPNPGFRRIDLPFTSYPEDVVLAGHRVAEASGGQGTDTIRVESRGGAWPVGRRWRFRRFRPGPVRVASGNIEDSVLRVERTETAVPDGAADLVADLYRRLPEARLFATPSPFTG